MFILSSSHLRGPLSSERCVQKGVRRLSRRRYAIRSAKVGLERIHRSFGIAENAVEDDILARRLLEEGWGQLA